MQSIWQQFTLCFPDTNSLSLDLLFPLLPNSRDTPPNLGPPIFPYYIAGKYLADFFFFFPLYLLLQLPLVETRGQTRMKRNHEYRSPAMPALSV